MSQKPENAKRLYLEGIRDGNARETIEYCGEFELKDVWQ